MRTTVSPDKCQCEKTAQMILNVDSTTCESERVKMLTLLSFGYVLTGFRYYADRDFLPAAMLMCHHRTSHIQVELHHYNHFVQPQHSQN